MIEDKTLSERLEINNEELSEKCAKASRKLIGARLGENVTEDSFITFVKEEFSYNELVLMTIGYLTDKTNLIMNQDSEIENIIERTAAKHGMPPFVIEAMKKMIGIKNLKNPDK